MMNQIMRRLDNKQCYHTQGKPGHQGYQKPKPSSGKFVSMNRESRSWNNIKTKQLMSYRTPRPQYVVEMNGIVVGMCRHLEVGDRQAIMKHFVSCDKHRSQKEPQMLTVIDTLPDGTPNRRLDFGFATLEHKLNQTVATIIPKHNGHINLLSKVY